MTLSILLIALSFLAFLWGLGTLFDHMGRKRTPVAWRYRYRSPTGLRAQWQYTPDQAWAEDMADSGQFDVEPLFTEDGTC